MVHVLGKAKASALPQSTRIGLNTKIKLVAVVEYKNRGAAEDAQDRIQNLKRELTSAISRSHGVRVSDLVLVAPGSIPITTSGKIRRSSCIELYGRDGFARLDGAV